jgi:dissimilatory sulfite reductase related protein
LGQMTVGDMTLVTDEYGFIQETDRWNETVAAVLAVDEGVPELTTEHWKIVRYMRQHYLEHGVPPLVRKLCKQTGFTLKRIYELFPTGPAKGVCRIAGLPNGKGCV